MHSWYTLITLLKVPTNKSRHLDELTHEPSIWSCDTGQWLSCFDSCQSTILWMSNIKDVDLPRHAWDTPPFLLIVSPTLPLQSVDAYVRSVSLETTKRKEADHILWVWGSVPRALRACGSTAIIYWALLTFESIRLFRLWSAVRRLITYHFQFNVCLNLSSFSFQQFLCIKYTTRLKKFMSSKSNFKKIYISISLAYLSIVDIYGNGRLTFQSWFIAIVHYLTF